MKSKLIQTLTVLTSLFAMVACNSNDVSFDSFVNLGSSRNSRSSDFSQIELVGVRQLRNPEGLSHRLTGEELLSDGYLTFKNKMQSFSTRLSEIIAKRHYKDGENYAVSPLSIELCLGLAIRCASGETRRELLNALDMDYETFNANYKLFYNGIANERKNYLGELTSQALLTNSIWIDDDVNLKEDGLDALRDDYYCYSYNVDFDKANQSANQAIKDFIFNNTKGLINPDLNLSIETLFVLMNTIYIKDIWNEEGFDLNYAQADYKFKNSNGVLSSKHLLNGHYLTGKAIANENYSSFFTSTNNGYHIYFVKPNEGKNIKDVFTKETMDYVLDSDNYVYQNNEKRERYQTQCIFPEYEANGDFDLGKIFKEELNVNTLFSACDFSNITNESVYCSEFKQLAKLKVDKTGIEGAAVTYMAYAGTAMPDDYKDIKETFLVDKEFGYILTYNDAVIFSGVVTNIDK